MRIFLHIGRGKTGTTTIQQTLHANADRLRERGILYPATGRLPNAAHHEWAWTLRKLADEPDGTANVDLGALIAALNEEIEEYDPRTLLLSSEVLSRATSCGVLVENLAQVSEDISVIAFVRRQDSYLEAIYAQEVRTGFTRDEPAEFLAGLLEDGYLDHLRALSPWADALGWDRIAVQPYEPDVSVVDSLNTLLAFAGVDFELERIPWKNERPSRRALEMLRAMPPERRGLKLFSSLIAGLESWAPVDSEPPGWEHFWTNEERQAVLDRYSDSNQRLAELARVPVPLFRGTPAPDGELFPGLSVEDAAAAARTIWELGLGPRRRERLRELDTTTLDDLTA